MLFLCIILWSLAVAFAFNDRYKFNEFWVCKTGCDGMSRDEILSIYGLVRHAMQYESSEIYYNIDHSWIKDAMRHLAKVHVHVVKRNQLGETVMPMSDSVERVLATASEGGKGAEGETQTYTVIYVPPDELNSQDEHRAYTPLEKSETFRTFDRFLSRNPCYLPLKDPLVYQYKNGGPLGVFSDAQRASKYENSGVIVKLPNFPYLPTCLLLEQIVRTQFPDTCPTKQDVKAWPGHDHGGKLEDDGSKENYNARAVWVGNIGWGNCVSMVINYFQQSLRRGWLTVLPRAWDDGAVKPIEIEVQERVKTDSEELRKVKVKPSGPWFAWADKAECVSDSVFALDPWSCFFIPIGGCNNWDLHGLPFEDQSIKDLPHGLRVGLKGKEEKDGNSANSASTTGTGENGDKNEKNDKVEVGEEQDGSKFTESPPYAEYRYPYYMLLQSLEKTRFLFGDSFPGRGTGNGINHWDESRVHLFVTRPNIQLRARLRVSVGNLVHMTNETVQKDSKAVAAVKSEASPANRKKLTLKSCIALHIRHGDSMNDFRGISKLDRSTAAHVKCVEKVSTTVGSRNVVVATDDTKALYGEESLMKTFPNYEWYYQNRALIDFSTLENHPSFRGYHAESSKMQEMSNLLADPLLLSRCSSHIGSSDGGFYHYIYRVACMRQGECPSSWPLQFCQPGEEKNM